VRPQRHHDHVDHARIWHLFIGQGLTRLVIAERTGASHRSVCQVIQDRLKEIADREEKTGT
jgi:hypothetical protein